MYCKCPFFVLPFLLFAYLLPAQTSKDATVALTASITVNPAGITLSWPNAAASRLIILRHTKTSPPNLWLSQLNVTNSTLTTLVDNVVSAGQTYEYVIQRTVGSVVSYGYVHVAVNTPVVDNRGKLLFFVDSTLMGPLGDEVGRLKLDMIGDGWTIVPHIIGSGATVQSMKSQIVADYNADPTAVKSVFLLGALPVPYSGNTNWDGHANHQGAWPADSYYADVNGIWTDASINNTSPDRDANDNIPGDGKFDQSIIPSNVELAVGRVDFRHLSPATFGASQVELYRRYLNKDHAWRIHEYVVENKAIVDDNFGYFNGEAFAANGYRNAYPLVGAANVVEGDFFDDTKTAGYLMGIGCGGGTYTSADGVGSSQDFATDSVNVVFTMLFGSYHGDWDYETDPFMPSALASKGGILTCAWAGRPHVFYEGLASGETIGYCTAETQNAASNTGFLASYGESGAHVSLLGDPSLRANVVDPPKDLVATPQCGNVQLSWTAATGALEGYLVYRSSERNGGYERLTENLITATTFQDEFVPEDTFYYQVRAIAAVSTPGGGTYLNSSTGAMTSLIFMAGNPPGLAVPNATITCSQPEVNLVVSSNLPILGLPEWQGPGGLPFSGDTIVVNEAGSYTVTVTAANGCTATSSAQVFSDTTIPIFTGTGGTLTCNQTSVTLGVGTFTEVSWSGPDGFSSMETHPVVMVAGEYFATITAANGCETTGSVTVITDTILPVLTLPTIPILNCTTICANVPVPTFPGIQILVNGTPLAPGAPLGMCLPGNYTISLRSTTTGCQDDYPITVTQNITPPNVTAIGGALACNASLQIHGTSTVSGALYQWSGPGTFNSSLPNPTVTVAGNYVLTVTDPVNGCTATASALVTNPDAPLVTASGFTLTCAQTSGMLSAVSNQLNVTYLWTGPIGFISTQQNPEVSAGGNYLVVVTALNGCSVAASVVVDIDFSQPNVTASGALLTCDQPTGMLQ
ncbi:MAG: fibronectin type III domain-containing protein, partial [Saprospiraceae bacterium]